jgi:hypothetical protein
VDATTELKLDAAADPEWFVVVDMMEVLVAGCRLVLLRGGALRPDEVMGVGAWDGNAAVLPCRACSSYC